MKVFNKISTNKLAASTNNLLGSGAGAQETTVLSGT